MSTTAQRAQAAIDALLRYNPGQPRDGDGKWTDSSGGGAADLARSNVDMTPDERQFLSDYVEDGRTYREINDALRGQREMTPEMVDKVAQLDELTARAELPGDTTLYRAMSVKVTDPLFRQAVSGNGNTLTDPGFGSVSGDRDAVEDFKGTTEHTIVFEISAAKGQPVLVLGDDLSDRAMMQTPQEALLPRGYKLRIDKSTARRRDGQMVWTVKATYLGVPDRATITAAFNPDQRRGPDGKWIKMGAGVDRPTFDGSARNGTPQRVSAAEFDRLVPPDRRFYRGVGSREGAAANREGQIGGGDYGPGVYMDPRISVAQGYAGRNPDGRIMRMGLKPGTKIKKIPERVKGRGSQAIDDWAREGGHEVLDTGFGYHVVRNPDALVVDDRDYTARESVVMDYAANGYELPPDYAPEAQRLRDELGIEARVQEPAKPDPDAPPTLPGTARPLAEGRAAFASAMSVDQAAEWVEQDNRRLGRKLPDAAAYYTGDGYRHMSSRLRNGRPLGRGESEYVRALDAGIEEAEINDDIVLWRGIYSGGSVFGAGAMDGSLVGAEWVDPAYVSTSARKEFTTSFARESSPDAVTMRLLVPKGTRGMRVGPWGQEAEVLLGRENRYRVVADHGIVDGTRRIDVEVIQGEPERYVGEDDD